MMFCNVRLYVREDRFPIEAERKIEELGFDNYIEYREKPNEDMMLRKLYSDIQKEDIVVVGSITDFMVKDISQISKMLQFFNNNDVKVFSGLETDYSYEKYKPALQLASLIVYTRYTLGN